MASSNQVPALQAWQKPPKFDPHLSRWPLSHVAHAVQFLLFFASLNFPSGHCSHLRSNVLLGRGARSSYSPAIQSVSLLQKLCLLYSWYVSAGHGVHFWSLSPEYCPLAQSVHVPLLTKVPGLHRPQ